MAKAWGADTEAAGVWTGVLSALRSSASGLTFLIGDWFVPVVVGHRGTAFAMYISREGTSLI